MLNKLLAKYNENQQFKLNVENILADNYKFVDNTGSAKNYTMLGRLYNLVCSTLNVKNNTENRNRIKSVLKDKNAIIIQVNGIHWIKGLVANDPTEDQNKANKLREFNSKNLYRKTYGEQC